MEEKIEEVAVGRPSNRRSDTRLAAPNSRPVFTFGGGSRFNMPREILDGDPEHDFGYVVYSSNNIDQTQNYNDACDRGWEPVRVSEYPSLSRQRIASPFSARDNANDFEMRGGQIAMRRLKEVSRQENEYHDQSKYSQEQKADAHKHYDPRMPRPHAQFSEHGRN